MWSWIADNNEVLSVLLSALMLIVWALYFQLLLSGYWHSRRSRILINRANGHSLATQCVVTNMSVEAIYVEGVIAELTGEEADDCIVCSLTDPGGSADPDLLSAREGGYQGPLGSGRSVELGPYGKIVERVLEQGEGSLSVVRRLRLIVVATYGPEDRPVAAHRRYDIVERAGRRVLLSKTVSTPQIRSSAERRQIERLMSRQTGERPRK